MRICLDTSAYSHFRRSRPAAVQLISTSEWVGIPAIVLGELNLGFLRGTQQVANNLALQHFLRNDRVEVLPLNFEVATSYAEIFSELLQVGKPIPTNDVWIAATCAVFGATLVTYDQHFQHIARIAKIVL